MGHQGRRRKRSSRVAGAILVGILSRQEYTDKRRVLLFAFFNTYLHFQVEFSVAFFVPAGAIGDLSILLVLRLLRVLRFFRIVHVFPASFSVIVKNFGKALRDCSGVFVSFAILIIIVALVSCALFRDSAPEYFSTPIDSIYSIFRICTGEGWNEIPDTIAEGSTLVTVRWVRLYFSILLVLCSIIGLSLVNSIFVDAMVSDNNEDLEKKVDELNKKIDALIERENSDK